MKWQSHFAATALSTYALYEYNGYFDISFCIGAYFGTYIPDYDIYLGIKHRGITHSIIFVTGLSLLAYLFRHSLGYGLFMGMALHLFLDAFTPMGLPYLLYPHKRRR